MTDAPPKLETLCRDMPLASSQSMASAVPSHRVLTSAGSLMPLPPTKDGVLTELIGMMFSRQFGAVRPLAANAPSPVCLYAVETALQLAMTELSENLRDIYVEAYTFPATAEIIHRSTTAELQAAFSAYLPGCAECDFYEMELGMAGMMRGYMARRCDPYFTLDFADSAMPLMLFRPVPQTAAL